MCYNIIMKKLILFLILILSFSFFACDSDQKESSEKDEVVFDINIEKVENLQDDFFMGVDISSVISLEKSGVKFYDFSGVEQDIFKTLSESGVNAIRARVWNDPFDSLGNGYGGGNCDLEVVKEIAKRAAKYRLELCVDFHYSDFWADPAKQIAPKAWKNYSLSEKESAIYEYTKNSLEQIANCGVEIACVQIGNEINNGLAGESDEKSLLSLLKSASKGVRDFSKEKGNNAKIVLHFTDINNFEQIKYKVKLLENENVDYDIFGVSYYSYWHGSLENLTSVLQYIKNEVNKQTMVMETAYPWTLQDGDCFANNVGQSDLISGYEATVQGQANNLRDVINATNVGGGSGVFYWEPAWIPVGKIYESNLRIWEKFGSGWASSYCKDYLTEEEAKWFGGSGWDNQTLFDFDGKPLSSLCVFKYVKTGAKT